MRNSIFRSEISKCMFLLDRIVLWKLSSAK